MVMAINASNQSTEQTNVDPDIISMDDNTLLVAWNKTQGILQTYKVKEHVLRTEIVRRKFSTAGKGTHTIDLPKGFKLKCVKKLNYRVNAKEVKDALAEIANLGNEGVFVADRLIKWQPELSLTEYNEITKRCTGKADNNADKIKAYIDNVLTISDAMPTLEIVEPKHK
jgi:hypothetical protein